MPRTTIDRLIINSPYEEPQRHWRYDREARAFELVAGRAHRLEEGFGAPRVTETWTTF